MKEKESKESKEFTEYWYHQTLGLRVKIKDILHSEQSKYQKIDVYDTEGIGKLLTLNGKTMVSEIDEFIYHEIMAHVPCAVARKNSKVLIIGGGDGGVVREFAKHSDIETIDLVEIDERVIAVSKKYFPQCTSALDDPRVKIHARDGAEFIGEKKNYYDIIIVDSTDPEDFALGLFTKEFYSKIHQALNEDGIMMAQTENPILDEFGIKQFYDNLREVFPVVESFSAPIIIYPGVYWSFAFASKRYRGTDLNQDNSKRARLVQIEKNCKWYNSNWHVGAFALSNLHRKQVGM
ncbi:MAG: polyamine aminopropyltransferase [Oligoflexia bacterium]|nr:polyamine aminopropyltransferase [Oligoflexia bacterium]